LKGARQGSRPRCRLFAGCFVAGYSNRYRVIFLLLMFPGLVRLALPGGSGAHSWVLRCAPAALVYSLWAPTTQHLVQYAGKALHHEAQARLAGLLDWVLHEAAWWGLATVALAALVRMALGAPPLAVRDRLHGPRAV
jgi:hypothetical protein